MITLSSREKVAVTLLIVLPGGVLLWFTSIFAFAMPAMLVASGGLFELETDWSVLLWPIAWLSGLIGIVSAYRWVFGSDNVERSRYPLLLGCIAVLFAGWELREFHTWVLPMSVSIAAAGAILFVRLGRDGHR